MCPNTAHMILQFLFSLLSRIQRDRQLMEKIKEHTAKVNERKKQPRGNPREEMEAAKRDLEMVSLLDKNWTYSYNALNREFGNTVMMINGIFHFTTVC